MPRYVKGKKAVTIEIAKTKVTIDDGTGEATTLARTAAEAKTFYEKEVAKLVAKGFALEAAAPKAKVAKAAKAGGKRYFESVEDGSSKFWEVWTEGAVLKTRFGKIGASGQIKLKELGSPAAAIAEYDKLIDEKTKKGYVEGGASAPAAKAPAVKKVAEVRNADLEAAIAEDPYDKNTWLALADWYQQQGNPRGELMALHIANKQRPAAALFTKYKDDFLGPLEPHVKCYDGSGKDAFTWRNGFIFGVRLAHDHYALDFQAEGKPKVEVSLANVLTTLLDHPSGRFITELTMNYNDDPTDDDLQDLIDILAKRAPKTIHRIKIGDDVDQISWYNVGDLSKLWKAVPHLRAFEVEAGSFTLGKLDLPELRRAKFETGGLSKESGMAIAKASWPLIEHLEIYYGDDNYGGECSIKEVKPLLARTDLAHLRYLGLKNAMFTDDICKALPTAKVIATLETLDLSMGIMTDEGARALAEHADAFAHLKTIDVSENYIGDDGQAALKKAFGKRVQGLNDQNEDDDPEYRSVQVGE